MAARRLHNLIYMTIANCCLFVIVCSVSLGTNQWFKASFESGSINVKVSYGLFSGKKTRTAALTPTSEQPLKIICQGSKGCMFSCGRTGEKRKQDFEDLYNKLAFQDNIICIDSTRTVWSSQDFNVSSSLDEGAKQSQDERESLKFINFGLYLATIAFIGLGMIFAILSGIFALYNTYRTPIQPILSVFGLYIWNSISASFVLLAMIMWIIEFSSRLRKNAAISDTLSGVQNSSGSGSLGYSFWILILPLCFAIANIAILKYRGWKIIKMDEKHVQVTTAKLESGDILLF